MFHFAFGCCCVQECHVEFSVERHNSKVSNEGCEALQRFADGIAIAIKHLLRNTCEFNDFPWDFFVRFD